VAETYVPSESAFQANWDFVRWSLDPDRAALLIHDLQDYFVRGFSESAASEILDKAKSLRRAFYAVGAPVALSHQSGTMTVKERGLMVDFWGDGLSADEAAWLPSLTPQPSDWLLDKRRYSAFYKTQLLPLLNSSGRDQLAICGVFGHVGILSTAIDAFSHNIQAFIMADAIGDFSDADHRRTLTQASRTCARVISTTEALRSWPSNARSYHDTTR
jgi:isochorismate hydrolase